MSDYSNGFSIGKVTLPGRVVLAPMAGVTDLPFRLLCKEQGADLICTEMVSAKGIYYNNKNTEDLLKIQEEERPVSLQLLVRIRILSVKWQRGSKREILIFWILIWDARYPK